MNYLQLLLLPLMAFFSTGCKAQAPSSRPLPLLIANEYSYRTTILVQNKQISNFALRPNEVDYEKGYYWLSSLMWFTDSTLIASRRFTSDVTQFTDLVLVDMNGHFLRQLTHNPNNHFSGCVPSPSRRKLLHFLTVHPERSTISEAENLRRALLTSENETISVWELDTNLTQPLTGLIRQGLPSFEEGAWSPDETQLVYSVFRPPLMRLQGQPLNPPDTANVTGSYIYNIAQQRNVRFLPGGKEASWSPNQNVIAYLKDNNVYLYDVEHDTSKLFRTTAPGEKPNHVRWLPDGHTLYVQYWYKRHLQKLREAFYDAATGQELNYAKPGLPDKFFSWQILTKSDTPSH